MTKKNLSSKDIQTEEELEKRKDLDLEELPISQKKCLEMASYEDLFDRSLDSILLITPGTQNILACNYSFERLFEKSNQEIVGTSVLEWIGRDSIDQFSDELRRVKRKYYQKELVVNWNKDEKLIPTTVTLCNVRLENDYEVIQIVVKDLTQQKALERDLEERRLQVFHAAKLSALGEMASGVSHELNNPLAIISGYFQQSQALLDEDQIDREKFVKFHQKISGAISRVTRVINSLRAFAGETLDSLPEKSEVSTVIERTLDLCAERLKKSSIEIRIDKEGGPDENSNLFMVQCNPIQVSHALYNLVLNSYDSIDSSKEGDRWVQLKVSGSSKNVMIEVIDSGEGIPQEIRNRVMEPFFTTKKVGEGFGLGLSVAKGLIETQGGKLYLDDKSKNTCFKIELPRVSL